MKTPPRNFFLIGLSTANLLKLPLNWLKNFGVLLGKIQTTLLLSLLYYFLLAPLGLVFQLVTFAKNIFSPTQKTHWQKREFKDDLTNIKNQY